MAHDDWLRCFEDQVYPFLQKYSPGKAGLLRSYADSFKLARELSDETTVCFLGQSNVGKSTLINAIAAGSQQLVPSGGDGGPLTALATKIRYGERAGFRVEYHSGDKLNQIRFALEKHHRPNPSMETNEEALEAASVATSAAADGSANPSGHAEVKDDYEKQARLLIKGSQQKATDAQYLAGCLRLAIGTTPAPQTVPDAEDASRIERIRVILDGYARKNLPYERHVTGSAYDPAFDSDLRAHAAGFLSPLIKTITVWWPSPLLKDGLVLVDLPGTGIAGDEYKKETSNFIQHEARLVLAVVDKSGFTGASVQLLSETGFLVRLLAGTDDRANNCCQLAVAVTKIDEAAYEEFKRERAFPPEQRRSRTEIYKKKAELVISSVKQQTAEELAKNLTTRSGSDLIREGFQDAQTYLLDSLEVYPVNAPEYGRFLACDKDDLPQTVEIADTGIPRLVEFLAALSKKERDTRESRILQGFTAFRDAIREELGERRRACEEPLHSAEESEKLRAELDRFMKDLRRDYEDRQNSFRQFILKTAEVRVKFLVSEAKHECRDKIEDLLTEIDDIHWSSLRATVRKGGRFNSSSGGEIDIPDRFLRCFQEPLALVWSTHLLKEIRAENALLAEDTLKLVSMVHDWARRQAAVKLAPKVIELQESNLKKRVEQMKTLGREAIDEMRKEVKDRLLSVITPAVKKRCGEFVQSHQDEGKGVSNRMREMFRDLATKKLVDAVSQPAEDLLLKKFRSVRDEFLNAVNNWGDPLDEAADAIVQRHETILARDDQKMRREMIAQIAAIEAKLPLN